MSAQGQELVGLRAGQLCGQEVSCETCGLMKVLLEM